MKKVTDTNWSYLELDRNDQRSLEHIFMQLKDEKFMLGGPDHWFEAVQRLLHQRGYEIVRREDDTEK